MGLMHGFAACSKTISNAIGYKESAHAPLNYAWL